ncbi:hypothetical protein DPMN_182810 [Dreissena polymorpha]|uniref:Uncharacterized protein n=1 Tax=Dreissena polymorpha TaxID=45954 RepID=A0A9D4DGE2_DREPO|nr:hypothetical protein DPMN_182810 [Dreissena polymorpha]
MFSIVSGGTADITAFQKFPNKNVKVIHKASGGPWRGIFVDDQYFQYLDSVLGIGVIEELRTNHIEDSFEMNREFEYKKRYSLQDIVLRRGGVDLPKAGKLRIDQEHDAGLVVLKGAVLFGHNPAVVTSRIIAHTCRIGKEIPIDHHTLTAFTNMSIFEMMAYQERCQYAIRLLVMVSLTLTGDEETLTLDCLQ